MKKLFSMLLTLVVLLSTTTSVEALESKTLERHNGASAYAEWYETHDNATTYTYLSVTETKMVLISMYQLTLTGQTIGLRNGDTCSQRIMFSRWIKNSTLQAFLR